MKPEELEMKREPRKSKFTVVHKPTGTVAEDPVAPGSYSEVRYRRAAGMPKENRPKGMTGFIEGKGEGGGIFPIIEADEKTTNDYLAKLAADPEALKRSFEGNPEAAAGSSEGGSAPANAEQAADPAAVAAAAAAAAGTAAAPQASTAEGEQAAPAQPAPAPEADTAEVSSESKGELDELLAGLE